MAQEFEKRRNFVVPRLNTIPGITCNMPHGAFYVFPQVSGLFGRSYQGKRLETSLDVADFFLDAAGVAVVPGQGFGDDRSMRISYASAMADLAAGLDRMEQAVQQLR
jgi:aspartate aminotransferase